MDETVETLELNLPLNMGSVNCYLIHTGSGFLLIDSGFGTQRKELFRRLEASGCAPGKLALILITHGDFDHTGNAAAVRERFGGRIAMHPGDRGMAEQADMFYGRKSGNALMRWLSPRLLGFRPADRFTADVLAAEGMDLGAYGWQARVVELPGHSNGSIGVLSAAGDLFCGDLLMNEGGKVHPGMGDPADFADSIAKAKGLNARRIYPGHGPAFGPEALP